MDGKYMNYDYEHNVTGIIRSKSIVDKTSQGLFYVIKKRLTNSYFHTSRGYRKIELCVAIIRVEGKHGDIEMIAGTSIPRAVSLIKELIREKIEFNDIPTIVELKCDYGAIDRSIENILNAIEPIANKEVAVACEDIPEFKRVRI